MSLFLKIRYIFKRANQLNFENWFPVSTDHVQMEFATKNNNFIYVVHNLPVFYDGIQIYDDECSAYLKLLLLGSYN